MNAPAPAASPGLLYRLLALPLYPLWLLHAIRHGRRHGLGEYLSMRLGGGAASTHRVWVHASSVGEVNAVSPLVRALLRRGESVLFTSFTATGFKAIRARFGDSLGTGVIPFDNCWHCRRFFSRHRIETGLVMETELWPELLYQARRAGVDLLLVNARLSGKSLAKRGYLRRLLRNTLGYFDAILTRNARDVDALTSLGARPERIRIVGNLKAQSEAAPPPARLIERDYLVFASSHDGEERSFLEARPHAAGDCLLVLAPRHPERSAEIQRQVGELGLALAVRSKQQPIGARTEVYLADTLGELQAFMAHARLVVMGGSFDATGGHNLIEPASLGRAIITGPADSNIAEDIALLGRGEGVLQVEDMAACWREIERLLRDPEAAEALGREARARIERQPDVVASYLAEIIPYL